MRKIVITGGPHAGKTSLLKRLEERGHQVLGEAALDVIDELTEELGLEEQRAWRRANRAAFNLRVAQRQAEREAALPPDGGTWFLDRGLVDSEAYAALYDHPFADEARALADAADYDQVLLLELVLPFSDRAGTGRTSDEATARRAQALLEQAYLARGFPVTRVPLLPPEERVERVLALAERPDYRLRPVTPDDHAALMRIHEGAFRPLVETRFPWDPEQQRGHVLAGSETAQAILVQGAVVGELRLADRDEDGNDALFLQRIMLDPAHQGRGLGSRIVEDLIARAARDGRAVALSVWENNRARALYRRLGFVETRTEGHKVKMRREPKEPS